MSTINKILIHLWVFVILLAALFNYFYEWPLRVSWGLIVIIVFTVWLLIRFNNRSQKTDYFCPLGIALLVLSLALLAINLLTIYNLLTLSGLIIVGILSLVLYLILSAFLKNSTENKIIGAFLLSALLISLLGITVISAPSSSTTEQVKKIINISQKQLKAPDWTIFVATKEETWWNIEIQSGVFKYFASLEQAKEFINSTSNKVYELIIPHKGTVEVYQTGDKTFEIYYNKALIKTVESLEEAKKYIYTNILK